MKSKFILIGLALLIFSTLKAQVGVHPQEYGTGNYLFALSKDSVYCTVNFSTGYSRMALVNPTTKAWQYLDSADYHQYLGPLLMKNNMEGIMTYPFNPNKVYQTKDGWRTITEIPNVAGGGSLRQWVMTDSGYVALEYFTNDLYFSPDGVTWTNAFNGAAGTNKLQAKRSKVMLYTGAGSGNYVSTDGGKTFSITTWGRDFIGTNVDFVMLSEDTFVLATQDTLYKTFDAGANWTTNVFPSTGILSIAVKSINEIFAGNGSGGTFFTTDGGANWQQKDSVSTQRFIYISDDLYAWPDYRSIDNGTTWQEFLPQTVSTNQIFDLTFKGSIGYLGKANGKVSFSTDGGRSFGFNRSLPTSQDIMAVKILHNGDFLAGNRNGEVFYSTNNGQSWTQRNTNTSSLNATKFSSSANDSVIVLTRGGQPIFSVDHGSRFIDVSVGGGTHSQTVKPNGDILDAVGWFNYQTFQNQGWKISKFDTTGNSTIVDTFLAATETLVDIYMVTDNIGYLIAFDNTTKANHIYKTTNGWTSGTPSYTSIAAVVSGTANYQSVAQTKAHFLGTDTIILVGDGNAFFHYSYDGGASWSRVSIDAHAKYPSLYPTLKKASHFFNANEFIVGLNNTGLYLNTSSAGILSGIREIVSGSDQSESIVAYPNPANDKIYLMTNISGALDINIYDVTGREVVSRIHHNPSDSIDVSGLPAGIYIVQAKDKRGNVSSSKLVKH